MTQPEHDEALVIEQRDRDAAADLYLAQEAEPHIPSDIAVSDAIRAGYNDHWLIVQAFARHRAPYAARIVELEAFKARVLAFIDENERAATDTTLRSTPNVAV